MVQQLVISSQLFNLTLTNIKNEIDIWDSIAMLSFSLFNNLLCNALPIFLWWKKNVLPIKSSASKLGIGLIIDGSASSCLNLIKTVGTFRICVLEPSEDTVDVPTPLFLCQVCDWDWL